MTPSRCEAWISEPPLNRLVKNISIPSILGVLTYQGGVDEETGGVSTQIRSDFVWSLQRSSGHTIKVRNRRSSFTALLWSVHTIPSAEAIDELTGRFTSRRSFVWSRDLFILLSTFNGRRRRNAFLHPYKPDCMREWLRRSRGSTLDAVRIVSTKYHPYHWRWHGAAASKSRLCS